MIEGMSGIAPFGLRMPLVLKNWLQSQARSNNRSMNAEINFALTERMEAAAAGTSPEKADPAAASDTTAQQGGASHQRF